MKQPSHQFFKKFFHISKYLAYNAEKILELKITKKIMSIASYVHMYIYTYVICDESNSK